MPLLLIDNVFNDKASTLIGFDTLLEELKQYSQNPDIQLHAKALLSQHIEQEYDKYSVFINDLHSDFREWAQHFTNNLCGLLESFHLQIDAPDPTENAIEQVLDDMIRPALHEHEGDIKLVYFSSNVAGFILTGTCDGCEFAQSTLTGHIARIIGMYLPTFLLLHIEQISSETKSNQTKYEIQVLDSKIHVACANGCGMAGIVSVLQDLGADMSVSDIVWCKEQKEEEMPDNTQILVTSAAMKPNHPLILKAIEQNIRIINRIDMINILFKNKKFLSVMGSHGKTTTAGMLSCVLEDQSFIIGGSRVNHEHNAKMQENSEYCIIELDEFDVSFENIDSYGCIVTSLSAEHLEQYNNNFDQLFSKFANYLKKVEKLIVLNMDDENVAKLYDMIKGQTQARIITYGHSHNYDYQLMIHKPDLFSVKAKHFEEFNVNLGVFGRHFVQNATSIVALCMELNKSKDVIKNGLESFKGMKRRLEKIMQINNIIFIDDYAHCYREINASIFALQEQFNQPITLIFEPHQKARLEQTWNETLKALNKANKVFVMDVFGARENISLNEKKALSRRLIEELDRAQHCEDFVFPEAGLVVAMGAGNSSKMLAKIIENMQKQ